MTKFKLALVGVSLLLTGVSALALDDGLEARFCVMTASGTTNQYYGAVNSNHHTTQVVSAPSGFNYSCVWDNVWKNNGYGDLHTGTVLAQASQTGVCQVAYRYPDDTGAQASVITGADKCSVLVTYKEVDVIVQKD